MTCFTPLIGRFGNALFQYWYARAFCEQNGHTLATPPWVGERIFDIPEAVRTDKPEHVLGGYCQDQASLIYTRKWCRETLKLKPAIATILQSRITGGGIMAHARMGDYIPLGYPVVSVVSYLRAADKFGIDPNTVIFVAEEYPFIHLEFPGELSFLPDFYRMMKAKVLFRGNSSFSYWASVLGDARTFSPCIKGKPGGVESDCEFSEGNHEAFCELPGITDLHLQDDQ